MVLFSAASITIALIYGGSSRSEQDDMEIKAEMIAKIIRIRYDFLMVSIIIYSCYFGLINNKIITGCSRFDYLNIYS